MRFYFADGLTYKLRDLPYIHILERARILEKPFNIMQYRIKHRSSTTTLIRNVITTHMNYYPSKRVNKNRFISLVNVELKEELLYWTTLDFSVT